MAYLGDIGVATAQVAQRAGVPSYRVHRPPSGMAVDIPALAGSIVQLGVGGVMVERVYSSSGTARFWDLQPGNYVATVMWGTGTGSAWSVVVTPSSYTVTRLGGGGVTGYIAVG
jgi:hypothetical protein